MPTRQQDERFAAELCSDIDVTAVMSKTALDSAIGWISSNLNPDDVFSEKDLQHWAESNGFVKEQN